MFSTSDMSTYGKFHGDSMKFSFTLKKMKIKLLWLEMQ